MTVEKINQVYKCNVCGNIVEVLHVGGGTLVCCGQDMELLQENTVDASKEKHVPVIEAKKIKIGIQEHPMTQEHHIEWIEASSQEQKSRVFLKPGDKPEAEFCFEIEEARAYCNLHGLWKN